MLSPLGTMIIKDTILNRINIHWLEYDKSEASSGTSTLKRSSSVDGETIFDVEDNIMVNEYHRRAMVSI